MIDDDIRFILTYDQVNFLFSQPDQCPINTLGTSSQASMSSIIITILNHWAGHSVSDKTDFLKYKNSSISSTSAMTGLLQNKLNTQD